MHEKELKTIDKWLDYGLRRISDRLFFAMIKAKLTLEEVTKVRNITTRTVKHWETRDGAPKNQNLIMELAELYNISYPWLSFHFGNEEYVFEQGFEPEYINEYVAQHR